MMIREKEKTCIGGPKVGAINHYKGGGLSICDGRSSILAPRFALKKIVRQITPGVN